MKITVIQIQPEEAYRSMEGLKKLMRGIKRFRSDLADNRVDETTLESFISGLRTTADYFETFLKDTAE